MQATVLADAPPLCVIQLTILNKWAGRYSLWRGWLAVNFSVCMLVYRKYLNWHFLLLVLNCRHFLSVVVYILIRLANIPYSPPVLGDMKWSDTLCNISNFGYIPAHRCRQPLFMLGLTCNAAIFPSLFPSKTFHCLPQKIQTWMTVLEHCPKKCCKFFIVPVWMCTPGSQVTHIASCFMCWIQVKQYKAADVSYAETWATMTHSLPVRHTYFEDN